MLKLIATDMDGTWLTDKKTYDQELFMREFKIMQERGIKFVVASGNQYANLLSRFPQVADKIYFIAENGALVAKGREVIHTESLSDKDLATLIKITNKYPYNVVTGGLVSAYVREADGPAYAHWLKKFFSKITVVKSFDQLDDQIFKVTFDLPKDKLPDLLATLKQDYPELGFVSGSTTSIDMSTKGMNKAVGLQYLSKKLRINPREMIAFGDSGNDVGMLKYAGIGYATGTAMPSAKVAADRIIGSSNDGAVQKEIWRLLNN
ncbi:HAD family hydrolase [Lactobacillus sp. ESL0791]|uniref:Cof-type HAD-IIB family hydrolase n=1 Tax=Lactobacillus sp. ESL0791 TaxID=2983234 RepID=UPI0023F811FE|nr:HAD family hydrolase [Lactobacillus sp. ESL0791]MDF7638937.1 HAD family hydrolase [Lactobacillus sp. ESL0791]